MKRWAPLCKPGTAFRMRRAQVRFDEKFNAGVPQYRCLRNPLSGAGRLTIMVPKHQREEF